MNNTDSNGMIFVFGSNLAGRHGAGAALYALKYHGAVYGQGLGMQGNSYAIPTKDERIKTLPLQEIKKYVEQFVDFATIHSTTKFKLTRVGCGLSGYKDEDIVELSPPTLPINIYVPPEWKEFFPNNFNWNSC